VEDLLRSFQQEQFQHAIDGFSGYYRYWGKADPGYPGEPKWHPLVYHCLDVAAAGRVFLEQHTALLKQLSDLSALDTAQLLDWCTFLLAAHDVGKFADGFQNQRPALLQQLQNRNAAAQYVERHDTLGFRFCQENVAELFMESDPSGPWSSVNRDDAWDILSFWIGAITGHHGCPPKLDTFSQPLQTQFPPHVSDDVLTFIQTVRDMLLPCGIPLRNDEYEKYYQLFPLSSWLMAGLTVISDWIGSNQRWFQYYSDSIPLLDYWQDIALRKARDAIRESGMTVADISQTTGMRPLFPIIKMPTPLQRLAESVEIQKERQLFIIEEVTGGGKTEAAITLAHRLMTKGAADGIFMALPTMATANAMHARIQAVYRKLFAEGSSPSLILAHSFSRMVLDMEAENKPDGGYSRSEKSTSQECAEWLMDSRKKAMLADVGVGTIDQALLSILSVRHQSLRLLGLARKVLIVDEVHACDAYVHRLLCTLLQFHAAQGGSAILLSATLPHAMRQQLMMAYTTGLGSLEVKATKTEYPLVTHVVNGQVSEMPVEARRAVSRSVEVRSLYSVDEVRVTLKNTLDTGGCACWVRNTVYDALQAYHEWVSLLGNERVYLFHARFALGDRLTIEQEVLRLFGPGSASEDRQGKLLIATQVVEQSLDLDFDQMVTDLVPIDLIIQRTGRLQRHDRGQRIAPVLGVFMPSPTENAAKDWFEKLFPKAAKVYDHHGQLWLTAKWLCERKKFAMPEDARTMIESVYGEKSQALIPEGLQAVEERAEGEDRADASLGLLNSLNLDEGYKATMVHWQEDAYAPTRLGEPTIIIRLARWAGSLLTPWFSNDSGHDWELSQISVRKSLIAEEDVGSISPIIMTAKEAMPDKGRYCVVIPLKESDGKWKGTAKNRRGGMVLVTYDKNIGLDVSKEIENESD